MQFSFVLRALASEVGQEHGLITLHIWSREIYSHRRDDCIARLFCRRLHNTIARIAIPEIRYSAAPTTYIVALSGTLQTQFSYGGQNVSLTGKFSILRRPCNKGCPKVDTSYIAGSRHIASSYAVTAAVGRRYSGQKRGAKANVAIVATCKLPAVELPETPKPVPV